jgi:hypothetical protein
VILGSRTTTSGHFGSWLVQRFFCRTGRRSTGYGQCDYNGPGGNNINIQFSALPAQHFDGPAPGHTSKEPSFGKGAFCNPSPEKGLFFNVGSFKGKTEDVAITIGLIASQEKPCSEIEILGKDIKSRLS